jgi:hypothetical protein
MAFAVLYLRNSAVRQGGGRVGQAEAIPDTYPMTLRSVQDSYPARTDPLRLLVAGASPVPPTRASLTAGTSAPQACRSRTAFSTLPPMSLSTFFQY